MGRRVKLQDTGEYSDSDISYKAENKKYYSSEDAYKKIQSNNEWRIKCIDFLRNILNYKDGMKLPTITYKKIKENEPVGLDVLYNTLVSQEQNILWALEHKQFNSETSKIMYIFAIIQNNIMDEYKKKMRDEKIIKIQNNNKIENIDIDNIGCKHRANDVSKFLGGI